jgi:hypothetical protein
MSFISNNVDFGIVSDSEILSIIANFSDDMVMDIIRRNSENKFRPYQHYVGNLVGAIESTFKLNQEGYPQFSTEILDRRNEIYSNILSFLCSTHGLSINVDENTDLYSLAFVLYDFTISKFTINMINFFANYIINETSTLYDYLNLRELKKNKDNSSSYSKKLFKGNYKLATIHANLEAVMDCICSFDIDIATLVSVATMDQNITAFVTSNIGEVSNLFRVLFVPYVRDPRYRAIIITLVRMRLQELEAVTDLSMVMN